MMHNIKNRVTWVTSASVFLLGSGLAWSGQEKQDGPWDMSETAAPFITPKSSVSIGIGYLEGNRQKLGMFDGQDRSNEQLLLDANIVKRDDATGTWGIVQGRDLGLNHNRNINVELEKQGAWGVRVGYDEIPRVAPYTVNSNTVGLGTTNPVVSSTPTAGAGTTYQIRTDLGRLSMNAFHFLRKDLKLNLSFRNETKDGTRQWGERSNSTRTPEFALEPVTWNTRQFESTLGYVNESLQLLGGYNGTWFGNKNTLVDTVNQGDNLTDPSKHTYLTLPLENEAHEFFLSGGYSFTPLTRTTFKFSYTRAMQDEHLPAMDIAGLSLNTAPSSLQGRVDTTLASLELTARPLPKLSLVTKLRYNDENDRTPAWLVVNTSGNRAMQTHSTPISNRTIIGKVEGTYRLPYQTILTGGVEYRDQKRDVPFGNDKLVNGVGDGLDDERFVPWRTNLDETLYRVRLRRHLSETVNGSLSYEHGIRKGSQYVDSTNIIGNGQGKINPFFIADRDRDKLRFTTDWRPIERLGIQFNAESALDRYGPDQEPYGRKKGHAQLYSVDTDYAPTDKWLFTAWYSYDINKTSQEGGRWAGAGEHEADKSSTLKDIGSSVGLGVRNQWNYKLKLGADFQHTRAESSYGDTVSVDPISGKPAYPAGVTPLSDIVSTTARFNTFVEYKGLGPGTLRGDFIHERWRTNDWTWQFSDGSPYVYGTKTDSTMITTLGNQSANFFGVRYTTLF